MFRRFFLLLLLSLFASTLSADGFVMPLDVNQAYLQVRYHHVNVSIDGLRAVTRVEQEFHNPSTVPVSGQYLFPIPPDMILSNIEFTLGSLISNPTRQDTATTNALIQRLVTERRDPSLLQFLDWETLALNIQLEANGSQKMTLRYEELLTPEKNSFHYRYIMSTERYTSMPLESVSMTIDIETPAVNVYSPSHPIVTAPNGIGIRVTWQAMYVQPTQNFDLFYTVPDRDYGAMLLTGEHEEQGHFLLMFSPHDVATNETVLPKDIVFVIDRSGSMEGEKSIQARSALSQILGRLNPQDRFSIVGFDDQMEVFNRLLQPVNTAVIRDALAFVDTMTARNATDIGTALQVGLQIFDASETRTDATPMVIFLTDGLPTAGLVDENEILAAVENANVHHANLHIFGVGYDVNTHLLDRLASDHGGAVTYVQPGENLETVMVRFYARISNPVLTGVTIEFEGIDPVDLYPQSLPDLFEGSTLVLAGRYQPRSEPITVRIYGKAGDTEREYVYTFDAGENHDFVPRLWATRRIGHLLDIVRVEGESDALRDEIRQIGLNYGIVTPFTTFIITPQTEGAASASNMDLYSDRSALNQVSGAVTVQARVQNMMYQEAQQAATGANVINTGSRSMAQVGTQFIDLTLLPAQEQQEAVTGEWISANIRPDRVITFGSEDYFILAADPAARAALQSGTHVLFSYQGQVILIQEQE